MRLNVFNELPAAEAAQFLRPCIDVDRWIQELVEARPFASLQDLTSFAACSAAPFSREEITSAMAHHPRIGQTAQGASQEANLSRGEQSTLVMTKDVVTRLAEANQAYEQRFNRVFLIRAAGRTSEEILAECERRLKNDEESELLEVADQLRAIALLRLDNAVRS